MIGYLNGKIIEEQPETLLLDVAGVGYLVHCSQNTLDEVFGLTEAKLWIFTSVREDAITLFGFSQKIEKQIFESLLKVNGIGPKMAIKVLSGGPTDQIARMIESADAKGLMKLPKIGKKTAEQIILTLKGKLQMIESDEKKKVKASQPQGKEKIHSALVNLGFKAGDVETIVESFEAEIDFEEGVRRGLAQLAGQ